IQTQQILSRAHREMANQIRRRKLISVAIDKQQVAHSNTRPRTLGVCLQHISEKLRSHCVVASGNVQEFATCELHAPVKCGVKPLPWNLVEPKTGISGCDRFKKLPTTIAGMAIEDDRLPIGERLG